MPKRKLVTFNEAATVEQQHQKPCSDCPWSRSSLPGWLGDVSTEEWLQAAHGETFIECHALRLPDNSRPQCAGAAIYRANVCKVPRDRDQLRLPADRDNMFKTPTEFLTHHGKAK